MLFYTKKHLMENGFHQVWVYYIILYSEMHLYLQLFVIYAKFWCYFVGMWYIKHINQYQKEKDR